MSLRQTEGKRHAAQTIMPFGKRAAFLEVARAPLECVLRRGCPRRHRVLLYRSRHCDVAHCGPGTGRRSSAPYHALQHPLALLYSNCPTYPTFPTCTNWRIFIEVSTHVRVVPPTCSEIKVRDQVDAPTSKCSFKSTYGLFQPNFNLKPGPAHSTHLHFCEMRHCHDCHIWRLRRCVERCPRC